MTLTRGLHRSIRGEVGPECQPKRKKRAGDFHTVACRPTHAVENGLRPKREVGGKFRHSAVNEEGGGLGQIGRELGLLGQNRVGFLLFIFYFSFTELF